jgi:hypothetical protein
LKPGIACLIILLPRCEVMALAIELDDQARGVTNEVCDMPSYGNLSSKTKAIDSMRLDVAPQ